MLFPAPYEVPEKTAKKAAQGAKKGPRRKSTPDMTSRSKTSSPSADDDDEEEEENDSTPEVGRRKRAAPTNPGAKTPKRLEALSRITPCGMLIAVRSDLPGQSLGPHREY